MLAAVVLPTVAKHTSTARTRVPAITICDFAIYDDTIPFVNAQKKANQALDKVMMVSQEHQVTMIPGYVDCATVLDEL